MPDTKPVSTENKEVHGLIIAGGSGTRLWPLSRLERPKQLLALQGGSRNLLQNTFAHLSRSVAPQRIKIVCAAPQRDQVLNSVRELEAGYPEDNILAEPVGKNSAPAVLWGTLRIAETCPQGVVAVLWSDQHIGKEQELDTRLAQGIELAREGALTALGITPTRPDAGLGYIQFGEALGNGAFKVARFIEKPDQASAEHFMRQGGYAWNAGIFAFNVQSLLEEYECHAPELTELFHKYGAGASAWSDGKIMDRIYREASAVPLDTLVLEKTERLCIISCEMDWNDLGSWNVLYEQAQKDEQGNAVSGNAVTLGTRNSLVYGGRRLITTVGVENLVVVDTEDALLICNMSRTQDIKRLAETLLEQGRKEATIPATTIRPWGNFTVIEEQDNFKIKEIAVKPGARLSLQKHAQRDEHWVIIAGQALVTQGKDKRTMALNDACYIPRGMVHRVENTGTCMLRFVEVQYGSYLGEDDITRLEDAYGRD